MDHASTGRSRARSAPTPPPAPCLYRSSSRAASAWLPSAAPARAPPMDPRRSERACGGAQSSGRAALRNRSNGTRETKTAQSDAQVHRSARSVKRRPASASVCDSVSVPQLSWFGAAEAKWDWPVRSGTSCRRARPARRATCGSLWMTRRRGESHASCRTSAAAQLVRVLSPACVCTVARRQVQVA